MDDYPRLGIYAIDAQMYMHYSETKRHQRGRTQTVQRWRLKDSKERPIIVPWKPVVQSETA
jgi:hypothetical protein